MPWEWLIRDILFFCARLHLPRDMLAVVQSASCVSPLRRFCRSKNANFGCRSPGDASPGQMCWTESGTARGTASRSRSRTASVAANDKMLLFLIDWSYSTAGIDDQMRRFARRFLQVFLNFLLRKCSKFSRVYLQKVSLDTHLMSSKKTSSH